MNNLAKMQDQISEIENSWCEKLSSPMVCCEMGSNNIMVAYHNYYTHNQIMGTYPYMDAIFQSTISLPAKKKRNSSRKHIIPSCTFCDRPTNQNQSTFSDAGFPHLLPSFVPSFSFFRVYLCNNFTCTSNRHESSQP